MNRLDETAQKESSTTGKGLSDSGYKTEPNTSQGSNATVTSEAETANYEEICKVLAPEIRPEEYRRVTENVDAQVVEKDFFLQRIMINEALLPLRMPLPEGTSKTGLLLKVIKLYKTDYNKNMSFRTSKNWLKRTLKYSRFICLFWKFIGIDQSDPSSAIFLLK